MGWHIRRGKLRAENSEWLLANMNRWGKVLVLVLDVERKIGTMHLYSISCWSTRGLTCLLPLLKVYNELVGELCEKNVVVLWQELHQASLAGLPSAFPILHSCYCVSSLLLFYHAFSEGLTCDLRNPLYDFWTVSEVSEILLLTQ